jgi:hypothetical protein
MPHDNIEPPFQPDGQLQLLQTGKMRGCAIEKRGIGRIGKRLPVEIENGKIIHGFSLIAVSGGKVDVEDDGLIPTATPSGMTNIYTLPKAARQALERGSVKLVGVR